MPQTIISIQNFERYSQVMQEKKQGAALQRRNQHFYR